MGLLYNIVFLCNIVFLYNIVQLMAKTALMPFNIFKNNVNFELMLNESLYQLKFDISHSRFTFAKEDHLQLKKTS